MAYTYIDLDRPENEVNIDRKDPAYILYDHYLYGSGRDPDMGGKETEEYVMAVLFFLRYVPQGKKLRVTSYGPGVNAPPSEWPDFLRKTLNIWASFVAQNAQERIKAQGFHLELIDA
jgi:hypothetical protein